MILRGNKRTPFLFNYREAKFTFTDIYIYRQRARENVNSCRVETRDTKVGTLPIYCAYNSTKTEPIENDFWYLST